MNRIVQNLWNTRTQALWFKYSKYEEITELFLDSFDAIKDRFGSAIVHTNYAAIIHPKFIRKCIVNIMQFNQCFGLNIKHMSLVQLKQAIADCIYYYNNIRVQEKLGWI